MGTVIRFPTVVERNARSKRDRLGSPRTHSGRSLEAKLLGLHHAGRRQKPRFTKRSR